MACHFNSRIKAGLVAVMVLCFKCFVAPVSNAGMNYTCVLTNWVPSPMLGTNYVIIKLIDQDKFKFFL